MFKIAISNVKGGVGKSTTTLCLSDLLASNGKKVLTIDLDSQNALTSHYIDDFQGYSIRDVLLDKMEISNAIYHLDKLDFIPADINLMTINHFLTLPAKETILHRKLACLDYDFIIIDTPPNLLLETSLALYTADLVIIPTQLNKWSITSIKLTLDWLNQIIASYGLSPKRAVILPTFYKKNTVSDVLLRTIADKYPDMVMHSKIRNRLDYDKVALLNLSLDYLNKSDVYADYQLLLTEVIK